MSCANAFRRTAAWSLSGWFRSIVVRYQSSVPIEPVTERAAFRLGS